MNVATDWLNSYGSHRVVIPIPARNDDAGTRFQSGDYVCVRGWMISNEGSCYNFKIINRAVLLFVVGRLLMLGLLIIAGLGRGISDLLP